MSKHCSVALSVLAVLAASLVSGGIHANRLAAGEPNNELTVRTRQGREFRGEADSATSRDQLVLTSVHGGVKIRRPIAWAQIDHLLVGDQPVEIAALRNQSVNERSAFPRKTISIHSLLAEGPVVGSQVATQPQAVARVASLQFEASLANWDGDVETDGLILEVAPVDLDGSLVAASGTLEVELFAPQRRELDLAPQSGGDTLELVERWTRTIGPGDFGSSGARLRLPFGAVHPELRPDWTAWHYGLVHVRLAAPGHGVFEASRDGVRIRPWAPNRDRLEMQTGGRFLWTERLGRPE